MKFSRCKVRKFMSFSRFMKARRTAKSKADRHLVKNQKIHRNLNYKRKILLKKP